MLRERDSDLGPLIDGLVKRINDQSERVKEPGFERKHISEDARKLLMQQTWPGNIREMENTLRRAMVWSDGTVVSTDDISDAMLPALPIAVAAETILNRPLEQGIDLKSLIDSVAEHYLRRAIDGAHGNKSRAAQLVGLPSYQTLTNWMRKYENRRQLARDKLGDLDELTIAVMVLEAQKLALCSLRILKSFGRPGRNSRPLPGSRRPMPTPIRQVRSSSCAYLPRTSQETSIATWPCRGPIIPLL